MKKKGFTLIELLAVLVILVVILAIAIPTITRIIEGSRGNTFTSHKKLVEKAARLYIETSAPNLVWNGNVSYVTIGELITNKYLQTTTNPFTNEVIDNNAKILIIKDANGNFKYSLQLYDDVVLDWYRDRMIDAFKRNSYSLPDSIGETTIVNLDELINKGSVDELRLPLDLTNRCAGYVEVKKTTSSDYEYNAYVDCLTNASTFASHYVSYGGKYLDEFMDVYETSDGGYIAVGYSNSETITKYETNSNGGYDGIIVKFSSNGSVEWSDNFGGSKNDYFYSVTESTDGYLAVGHTASNDGDLASLYKGGDYDAIMVKYNKQGEVTYKRSYGGSGTNGSDNFRNVMFDGQYYIITGVANLRVADGDFTGVTYTGSPLQHIILKVDTSFNVVARKFYSGGGYTNVTHFEKIGTEYVMLANIDGSSYAGQITKLDSNFNVVTSKTFSGLSYSKVFFQDLVKVADGYIVAGYSQSTDGDMAGLSKASNSLSDAIIVKYDNNLQNVIWKKSFGGTEDDAFNSIKILNDNEVVAVGNSKSTDMDMAGLAKSMDGYADAIMTIYNINNGNLVEKKIFGGLNRDNYNRIIKTSANKYIAAGSTYSTDDDLKDFNKGHSDAILVSYNSNLELDKSFQEPVIIIDRLKEITTNYGTALNMKYNNIYTTNDPTKDLQGWCSAGVPSGNNNYDYGYCLKPFNNDDIRLLTNIEANATPMKLVYQGEHEYAIEKSPTNFQNWYVFDFYLINTSATIQLSNFKLKFSNGSIYSVADAITNNYIEPLVIASNYLITPPFNTETFPNPVNLMNTNGNPGGSTYPTMQLILKPKYRITSVIFTCSHNIDHSVGFKVQELRNFDISITKTE